MTRHWLRFGAGPMIALAVFGGAATAQMDGEGEDANVLQLEDYLDFETVGDPQISPDGEEVLYTRTRIDKMKDKRHQTLWLMDADGSNKRQLMEGSSALWSPDGSRIAFVKADENDKAQIFVRQMDGEGLVTQVTSYEYAPRTMAWSPDGEHIAFVARVKGKPAMKIDLPGRPEGAQWKEDPVFIDTLHYRQDRVGYTNGGYDHLFVVPADGGTPRQLTDGEWNVGVRRIGAIAGSPTISWSPDSRLIAFDGPGKPTEAPHYFESHINVVDIESGDVRQVTEGRPTFSDPAFSPDGNRIAFTGYEDTDLSYTVSNLYTIGLDGDGLDVLAEDLADGPGQLHWHPDGDGIFFTMNENGSRQVHMVDDRGRIKALTEGQHMLSLASMANDGTAALVMSDPQTPPTIVVAGGDRRWWLEGLTNVNDDIFHGKELAEVEEFWIDSEAETGETARVQGWIVKPPMFDESKEYPLLLSIHGGPHAMYNTGFDFTFQEFAARGYVVLYMNPRGSTGYGSDFANAIQHRYPGPVDYADLMNSVDEVVSRGYIDEDRMFVTGCSGGGVLTTWIVGNTDRFAAAAALCPVTNWIGMSGSTDVVAWLYNFFPQPYWEDPELWLAHSPLMKVGNVTTPTLLMTGTDDLRTPIEEAEAYYAALKMRGVDTMLVPMPNEYHGTRSVPSNYLRTSLILRKWFDKYDPAKADEQDEPQTEQAGNPSESRSGE
ncbi:MAG: S9 family peptidase [Parvularcula sp.]|jgi:dipeptidyl aminopeptidase/acylaminoacyl peptidase|nr:S9 family peptidase [Parvularcula sp.]